MESVALVRGLGLARACSCSGSNSGNKVPVVKSRNIRLPKQDVFEAVRAGKALLSSMRAAVVKVFVVGLRWAVLYVLLQ